MPTFFLIKYLGEREYKREREEERERGKDRDQSRKRQIIQISFNT